jgi:hypothetical protein
MLRNNLLLIIRGFRRFRSTFFVIVSIFIATPISYSIAQYWLANFAYRIEFESWYFAGAGLLAVVIAWFTVSVHAIRAANVNAVECLGEE